MFKKNKQEIDNESKIIIERIHKDLDIILEDAIKRKDVPDHVQDYILNNYKEANYSIEEKVTLAVKAKKLEPAILMTTHALFGDDLNRFEASDLQDILNKLHSLIEPVANYSKEKTTMSIK